MERESNTLNICVAEMGWS